MSRRGVYGALGLLAVVIALVLWLTWGHRPDRRRSPPPAPAPIDQAVPRSALTGPVVHVVDGDTITRPSADRAP
jgi:hypothetical protein